ncbi:MAG: hypothetical protein ACR2IE_09030 [Candidatus Sumerlaeaceae bacterium]
MKQRKSTKESPEPEMRAEYQFGHGVRGRFYQQYRKAGEAVQTQQQPTNASRKKTVVLSSDVAEVFPDSVSVNKALRSLIEVAKKSTSIVPTPVRVNKPLPARSLTSSKLGQKVNRPR